MTGYFGMCLWPITQFINTLSFEQIMAILDSAHNPDLLLEQPYSHLIRSTPHSVLRTAIMRSASEQARLDSTEKAFYSYKKHQ